MQKTSGRSSSIPRFAVSAAIAVLAAGALAAPVSAAPVRAGSKTTAATVSQTPGLTPVAGLNLLLRADPWKVAQTRRAPDGNWDTAREIPQFAGLWNWTSVVNAGELRMFAAQQTSTGGKTYVQSTQEPGGNWSGLTPMAGLAELPHSSTYSELGQMAVANVAAQNQLVAIDGAGRVVHTLEHSDGTWQPWGTVSTSWGLGSDQFYSVATAEVNGELHLVGSTMTGQVLHTVRHADGTWSGWGDVMGQTGTPATWGLSRFVVLAPGSNGALQVVVTDNSQVPAYHAIRNADGSWTRWGDIASQVHFNRAGFQGFQMAGVDGAGVAGELQLVFESNDNRGSLYHTIRHADGSWDGAGLVQSAVDLSAWRPVAGSSAAGG